jgi:4-hydroxybenzoate polyprenyltransferase
LKAEVLIPGILTTIMLWANYPMTQIYQHEEDARRGDRTFSLMLGIRGTFYFTAAFFGLAMIGFVIYLSSYFGTNYALVFLGVLTPVLLYFLYWFNKVRVNENLADYSHTMLLNFISATCLNGYFVFLFLDSSHVLQALRGGF